MVVSWVICLLQDCVYLKLVVLHGVIYFMVVTKTTICLVSFDGVRQWFTSAREVVGGIDEWECGKTCLTSCMS